MMRQASQTAPSINRFRSGTEFKWPLVQMGDVVTLHYGKGLTEGSRRPGPVPVYGTNGRTGWHDTALASGPTVILGRKGMGNLGVEWCEGPFWVIDTAYYTSFREDVVPRFFYYFANYVGLNHLKDGTSNPSLTRETFSRQWFPLPPIHEQQRIASLCAALDDKVELNRQTSETLEAMAHTVFKSWFVDFDPVLAKVEGRDPCGINAQTAALFPSSFQDSSLGKIPKGWGVGTLNDLVQLSHDTLSPREYANEVFDHYSIPAFDTGRWPTEEAGIQIKSNKAVVPLDAILLSKLNPRFPRVWMPLVGGPRRSIASTEFLILTSKAPMSREYVFCLFNSQTFLDIFESLVTGTSGSHQRVKPEFLLAMQAVVAPLQVIDSFTQLVVPMLAKSSVNLRQSRTLSSLRDTLLPKLISGELRLKEPAKVLS
jgi:type I restriction enzyme S subunit